MVSRRLRVHERIVLSGLAVVGILVRVRMEVGRGRSLLHLLLLLQLGDVRRKCFFDFVLDDSLDMSAQWLG